MANKIIDKRKYIKKSFAIAVLTLYNAFLIWRMYFYAYASYYRTSSKFMQYNIIPFKTITQFIKDIKKIDLNIFIYNLFGNIAVFIPIGFLLAVIFDNKKIKIISAIFIAVIFIAEAIQFISRRGVFDIDDIILNFVGCLIGYYLSFAISKKFNNRNFKSKI